MPAIDPIANAQITIDTTHERTHQGVSWLWQKRYEELPNGQTVDTLMIVHGDKPVHLSAQVIAGGAAWIDGFQVGSWIIGDGEAGRDPVNRNSMFSDHVSSVTFISNASIQVASADITETIVGGSGAGSGRAGGGVGQFTEVVLVPGTYGLRITNKSNTSLDYAVQFDYYEPANHPIQG